MRYIGVLILTPRISDAEFWGLFMKVYIVRHGQSLGNAKHVLLGHTDLDLTELGYKQARATASAMRDIPIDIIYSSDLMRAYNTAVPHAELRGMSVIADEGFRECCIGAWENKSADWCREHYPIEFGGDWFEKFGTFTFPEGEGIRAGGERFLRRATEVCRENPDKTVLIVSHAAVIRSFYAIVSGIAPEDVAEKLPFPTNASYSVLEFDGENFIPVEYSVDGHLESIGVTKIL